MEELWQLFPIFLVPPDQKWKAYYKEREESLKGLLAPFKVARISHIGSTAVSTIWAKNIVDILIELEPDEDMDAVTKAMEEGDYIFMNKKGARRSFNMGYTENGFAEKVFHVHLRYAGDNDEIYFRDYLIAHPDVAKEYETLKLSLWRKFEHDRDGYTEAKSDFIKRVMAKAKPTKRF